MNHDNKKMLAIGGRIWVMQCTATSKRSGLRCKGIAMKPARKVCYYHGGKSTGPRTEAGRRRCAAAKTIHGNDTRQARKEYSEALLGLYKLELLGRKVGLIVGAKIAGRKPTH
jgi:hypothetical protein